MAKDRVERRLAAIMATDIVGYSRLIEIDETGTLGSVKRLQSSIFNPTLSTHGGRTVKLMGDGALIVFNSAVDAVNCAVSLQNGIALDQRHVAPDRRIFLRVGINLADVVVEGDDLFGDGVNIAARLETLAHPGGICIADIVQRQLAGKSGLAFEDGGEMSLKNITRPVRVWHWMDSPTVGPAGLPPTDRPTIAVLPFENLSGQPDETFFSDGITEDIITGLARFRSLSVVAANSSFNFRGKPISLKEIGRQLGAAFLVEGSIRRAGERIRVTAQLIEAANGEHHWADRFDRSLIDVFAVQDEVAKMIVSTLVGRIEEAKFQQSLRKPTVSLAAYEYYLRGIAHLRGYADDDNQQACRMLEAAIERDPWFALAFAYLALAQVASHGYADSPAEVLNGAYAMAKKAVSLDGQESVCHRMLAVVCTFRREFEMAERHFRQAYQLNPNDANGLV
jgi:adenylate cyclase